LNALLICVLLSFYGYYGDSFKIERPTGSRNRMNLFEVAWEIANRFTRILLGDKSGRRPGPAVAIGIRSLVMSGDFVNQRSNVWFVQVNGRHDPTYAQVDHFHQH